MRALSGFRLARASTQSYQSSLVAHKETLGPLLLVTCTQMSHGMRKLTFCICENKDADQLRGNCEANQRLCFRYIDSMIPLHSKYEISSLLPSSVAVSVGPGLKPECWFSHDAAQMTDQTGESLGSSEPLVCAHGIFMPPTLKK